MASGLTVPQIARLCGVSLEPFCGQIKVLFTETGAKRQSQLGRLVLALNATKH